AALAVLFDLIREANSFIDQERLGSIEAAQILEMLEQWDRVLAVLPLQAGLEAIPSFLLDLLKQREDARVEKNWRLSDELRDQIYFHGFVIEDTPSGARLKRKS
ncbi:MAG: cysteine--tRNA ligase, partial [Chlamydiales bacterium]|nr:cysteine--tRNA ligase [Chlamydiales bacterium]